MWIADTSFAELVNALTSIFFQLNTWEISLLRIASEGADIKELLEISVPVFGNPINLLDLDMNCDIYLTSQMPKEAVIEDADREETAEEVGYRPLRKVHIQQIHERIQRQGYDTTPRFCTDYIDKPLCCMDLFYGKLFIGIVGVIGVFRPLFPSDGELLQILAAQVEAIYRRRQSLLIQDHIPYKDALRLLLTGQAADDSALYRGTVLDLAQRQGGKTDLLCFRAVWQVQDGALPLSYLSNLLDGQVMGCLSCTLGDCVAGVLVLRVSEEDEGGRFQQLEELAERLQVRVGLSTPFQELSQASLYLRQAARALELSERAQASDPVQPFQRWLLPYLLNNGIGEFPVETLCPPELLRLWEEHRQGKNDRWDTLRTYLRTGRNAAEAARQLYMHRSTFLKRLQTVSRILRVDLHGEAAYEPILTLQMLVQLLELERP